MDHICPVDISDGPCGDCDNERHEATERKLRQIPVERCACTIKDVYEKGSNISIVDMKIVYCKLHKAAPELLSVVEQLLLGIMTVNEVKTLARQLVYKIEAKRK